VVFDPSAKGSHAFVDFAKEMVDRVKRMGIAAKKATKAQ
jgi:chromosome partitioning protein